MGGDNRIRNFITNSPNVPLPTNQIYAEEPIYAEILQPAQMLHRLEPLHGRDFTPIISSLSSPQNSNSEMMGQRAARFNLANVERLLDKKPHKALRLPRNPIVLTKRHTNTLISLILCV